MFVLMVALGIGGLSYTGVLPWRDLVRAAPDIEFDLSGVIDGIIARWSPDP